MEHGTPSSYGRADCRCSICTEFWREYQRTFKEKRLTREPPAGSHGKNSTYVNWGCRCDDCKADHAKWSALYRARRR